MSNTVSNSTVQPSGAANPDGRDAGAMMPLVDVIEDSTGITLYADLPGVSRERLDLQVEGNTLTIKGELALPVAQGMQSSHAEVQAPHYQRSFSLSNELDPSKIGAELRQGVLRVRIPKADHAQPRRIEVAVA